mmetsp:Transcript_16799/g.47936  ORF Transcript_16799/g.47936 Transcript_16799/m.47936 type:complete len:220 (-) Transcript_16799:131-790(-)
MSLILFLRRRAFSYFSMSALPLKPELAASQTYLVPFNTFSFQYASQVTSCLCTMLPQLWPGSGQGGTGLCSPMLIVICSGMTRFFRRPILGWNPRPRKRPGGSTITLPTFWRWPSTSANEKTKRCASASFFLITFSSLLRFLRASRSRSTYARRAEKSQRSKFLMRWPFPRTFRKSSKKFLLNSLAFSGSLSMGPSSGTSAYSVAISSCSGVSSTGSPS